VDGVERDSEVRRELQSDVDRAWSRWYWARNFALINVTLVSVVVGDYLFIHQTRYGPHGSVEVLVGFVILQAGYIALAAREKLNEAAWNAWWFDNSEKFLQSSWGRKRTWFRSMRGLYAIRQIEAELRQKPPAPS
jgi:hypothetical protein